MESGTTRGQHAVRIAEPSDAEDVGRLLHDFNAEYSEPTPGPEVLAERISELIAADETTFLLVGEGPYGIAELRFRPSVMTGAPDCYLEELYVVPEMRGRGMGRALMDAVLETARSKGATHIDLGTNEDDVAARALYERMGFTNREGGPDGPAMLFYERDL